jgi:hypothetical protein
VNGGKEDRRGPGGRHAWPGGLLALLLVLLALSGVALPTSRAFARLQLPAGGPSPRPLGEPVVARGPERSPVSCARAQMLVIGAHPALFALLRPWGVRVTCGARPLPGGERLVWVTWQGRRSAHEAIYRVTPDWVVRPGDATAWLLEELADYGPLARPVLEE